MDWATKMITACIMEHVKASCLRLRLQGKNSAASKVLSEVELWQQPPPLLVAGLAQPLPAVEPTQQDVLLPEETCWCSLWRLT